ncbi:uncharacterized protein LOC121515932 [Cheilinus undulatus]|uniref:uncharacterized protein LOC121515932 n=1 Tax=Cheilinus undulatus TaxID=241271 RepID=UPI001BD36823|nr:uncharacterized protein LOC121515932 [Cheilinus undulatus]
MLLFMTVSCLIFGSFAEIRYEELCYGRSLKLPFAYTPPLFQGQIYFTPSNGGPTKLLMEKGESKDPRIQVSYTSAYLKDLTDEDAGTFSVSFNDDNRYDIIRLTVMECAIDAMRFYGERYYLDVPQEAEYLEFTPSLRNSPTTVLWNRTDPQVSQGSRGKMKKNAWEIIKVTGKDSGYYNVRRKDRSLLSRTLLKVEADSISYDRVEGDTVVIEHPTTSSSWTITFKAKGETEYLTLMKAGRLSTYENPQIEYRQFEGRLRRLYEGLEINPLKTSDSGIYEVRDNEDHPARIVKLSVRAAFPTYVIICIAVRAVLVVSLCCCWIRKCCCFKKSSSKRSRAAPQTAAAPGVYNHGWNQQPAGPSHSAAPVTPISYQPVNPSVPREPAVLSSEPPLYRSVSFHRNPLQPEAAPLGDQGGAPAPTLGSDCLSSDPGPRFELKGLNTASALPLSSDSTFCNVYTSDKLNFL